MDDMENGMVIGAQSEWDAMYDDDIWGSRTKDTILGFIYDNGYAVLVLQDELQTPHINEVYANDIWDVIKEDARYEMAEAYIARHGLYDEYEDWVRDSYDGY